MVKPGHPVGVSGITGNLGRFDFSEQVQTLAVPDSSGASRAVSGNELLERLLEPTGESRQWFHRPGKGAPAAIFRTDARSKPK
jgi:hypothetical protein